MYGGGTLGGKGKHRRNSIGAASEPLLDKRNLASIDPLKASGGSNSPPRRREGDSPLSGDKLAKRKSRGMSIAAVSIPFQGFLPLDDDW